MTWICLHWVFFTVVSFLLQAAHVTSWITTCSCLKLEGVYRAMNCQNILIRWVLTGVEWSYFINKALGTIYCKRTFWFTASRDDSLRLWRRNSHIHELWTLNCVSYNQRVNTEYTCEWMYLQYAVLLVLCNSLFIERDANIVRQTFKFFLLSQQIKNVYEKSQKSLCRKTSISNETVNLQKIYVS